MCNINIAYSILLILLYLLLIKCKDYRWMFDKQLIVRVTRNDISVSHRYYLNISLSRIVNPVVVFFGLKYDQVYTS